tara:strand:+ start:1436 stop:2305 length:870 start_codon:yes stop_codon:yes gene_type:complete
MEKKLNRVAKDTNIFLTKYLSKQKKTNLLYPMRYGLLPGGKKIRAKIIVDIGKIFSVNYKTLIHISAAVECIHAYSLIHDDLPCMDDDILRRGKLTAHKKFGESTAILAGNSLLTIAFEILTEKNLNLKNETKIELIKLISKCSGHSGIAGGQYSDLSFEKKKISLKKTISMQINKTGKLFSFCCMAPLLVKKKKRYLKRFESIGLNIGLLFQISDDLIDLKSTSKKAGKKTKKDLKKGKATLINLLGYENTIKYAERLKMEIFKNLSIFEKKSNDLKKTINFITQRSK